MGAKPAHFKGPILAASGAPLLGDHHNGWPQDPLGHHVALLHDLDHMI
jgi:hypothetical protein